MLNINAILELIDLGSTFEMHPIEMCPAKNDFLPRRFKNVVITITDDVGCHMKYQLWSSSCLRMHKMLRANMCSHRWFLCSFVSSQLAIAAVVISTTHQEQLSSNGSHLAGSHLACWRARSPSPSPEKNRSDWTQHPKFYLWPFHAILDASTL